jgi:hypothetical protein
LPEFHPIEQVAEIGPNQVPERQGREARKSQRTPNNIQGVWTTESIHVHLTSKSATKFLKTGEKFACIQPVGQKLKRPTIVMEEVEESEVGRSQPKLIGFRQKRNCFPELVC